MLDLCCYSLVVWGLLIAVASFCWGTLALALRLHSCGTGLVATWNVGSSRASDWIRVPCIGRWILYLWATREAGSFILKVASFPWKIQGKKTHFHMERAHGLWEASWFQKYSKVVQGEAWQLSLAVWFVPQEVGQDGPPVGFPMGEAEAGSPRNFSVPGLGGPLVSGGRVRKMGSPLPWGPFHPAVLASEAWLGPAARPQDVPALSPPSKQSGQFLLLQWCCPRLPGGAIVFIACPRAVHSSLPETGFPISMGCCVSLVVFYEEPQSSCLSLFRGVFMLGLHLFLGSLPQLMDIP